VIVVTHDPRMGQFTNQLIYLLDGKTVDESIYQETVQRL
jgi:ABC-type lipoprotein export system ATPase subunit